MERHNISARVNPLSDPPGKVKAMANVTIDGVVAINNLTIVEGANGNFVGYPQTKDSKGDYRDIVEFIKDENGKSGLKTAINATLLKLYESNERQTATQEVKPADHNVTAFVTPLRDSQNATKGLATVQVGGLFKINSIRVNENSTNGNLFAAMPSRPDKSSENGYREIIHPVTKDFGEKLKGAVLKQYENQVAWKNRTADKAQAPEQNNRQAANKSSHDLG